jgi:hypothetical protein
MTHELIGKTLYVERHKDGTPIGIIGRCTCGWNTGHRFTSFVASSAFMDHQEEMAKKEAESQ